MDQQLQVFKDPSIVANHPTTPLEQLQLATEAKAARMAAGRGSAEGSLGSIGALYGGSGPSGSAALQAIEHQAPGPAGYIDNNKSSYRMESGSPYINDPFGAEPPPHSVANLFGGLSVAGPALFGGLDFSGPSNAVTGGPGFTERDRIGAPPSMPGYGPAPHVSIPTPATHGIADLFGWLAGSGSPAAPAAPAAPATPGYNGTTSVHSGELAGANRGFGGENAQMPNSMNNSRWLTGY